MKKVLITGASGLLGEEAVRVFRAKNYDVIALYNNNPQLLQDDVVKIHCDISNASEVSALQDKIKDADLILHCAAITNIKLCEENKELCYRVNVLGTKNICDFATTNNIPLVYISTSSVFDGKVGNYKEEDEAKPINYYNESKLEGEKQVLKYTKGIVVRTTPIGIHKGQRSQASFLEWLVDSFKNNLDINLFTDVKINPLTTTTLSNLLSEIPSRMSNGIINLGSQDNVSKAEIGLEVKKFFPNYTGKVTLMAMTSLDEKIDRPKEMWLNVNKALELGFELPFSIPDLNRYFKNIAF